MDSMDFSKKRPKRPRLHPETEIRKMDEYIRSLNLDGLTLLPGESQPQEMTGVDPDHLKAQLERNIEMKSRLLRDMAATWQCTQCRREQSGKFIRVRVVGGTWETVNGVRTLTGGQEVLVCRYQTCNGPVIKIKDPYRTKLI